MKKELHLRLCLTFSSFILALWGSLSLPTDACITTISWNTLFFLINAAYSVYIFKTSD